MISRSEALKRIRRWKGLHSDYIHTMIDDNQFMKTILYYTNKEYKDIEVDSFIYPIKKSKNNDT